MASGQPRKIVQRLMPHPVHSSSLASAARKPLATRNTIGSRSNSGSSLNERRMTVAGTQPTTEKPRAAGKGKFKCDQNSMLLKKCFASVSQ